MLPDILIFAIGATLAASAFLLPAGLRSAGHHAGHALIVALYMVAFTGLHALVGTHAAFAAVLLGLIITVLGKVLAINFRMVQVANHPKHRRCY